MRSKIVNIARSAALAAILFAGVPAALAQDAGDEPPEEGASIVDQAKAVAQSDTPAQAAMVQMGLTQEQLSTLFGTGQEEEDMGTGQRKVVYKPKSATEVEEPPRLFYNIPKWK